MVGIEGDADDYLRGAHLQVHLRAHLQAHL